MVFAGGFGVEAEVELVLPAELEPGAFGVSAKPVLGTMIFKVCLVARRKLGRVKAVR